MTITEISCESVDWINLTVTNFRFAEVEEFRDQLNDCQLVTNNSAPRSQKIRLR